MPDDDVLRRALDIARRYRDPALDTTGFQPWPTLPSRNNPLTLPRYIESDPTPWEGGDFPTHPNPLGIAMALAGAKMSRRTYHGNEGGLSGGYNSDAAKKTGGSFNRYGMSSSPDPKVGSRYATDFGGSAPAVTPLNVTLNRPLYLTAQEFEKLQKLTGKFDRGEPLSELDHISLEDMIGPTYKEGVHPIDALHAAGIDGLVKDAGPWGIAEPEVLNLLGSSATNALTGDPVYGPKK